MIFAISSFFPSSPWQAWRQLRPRSWSYVVTPLPSRAGDFVWPVSSSVPVSAVKFVSAVALRHRGQAKRNGAFAVRYCLRLRVTRSIVNHFAIGTPGAVNHRPGEQPMHHSVWPKMAQRETQVQTTTCKTGIGL